MTELNSNAKEVLFKFIKENEEQMKCFCDKKCDPYTYLFGTSNYNKLLNEKPKLPSYPYYDNNKAYLLDEEWRETRTGEALVFRGRKSIPPPIDEDINLLDHLLYLANEIYKNNEKRNNWKRSLNSFLNYLRQDMPSENLGILESIFPYEKEIRPDYTLRKTEKGIEKIQISLILRNIENEEYPIDILAYSEIIQILINTTLYGRANAQLIAAEALGLTWLCFTNARMHLFTQETYLHATPLTALKKNDEKQYVVQLKSLFGDIEVCISETIYNFFRILSVNSNQSSIFSRPLSSLRRAFNKAVNKSSQIVALRESFKQRNVEFAKITFKTMMQMPYG